MSCNAPAWSRRVRRAVETTLSMEDILEEGTRASTESRPGGHRRVAVEGDPMGECIYVYQGPNCFCRERTLWSAASPSGESGSGSTALIKLAELLAEPGLTEFTRKPESEIYPDPAPSAWHSTTDWKGNFGRWPIKVTEAVSLREVLRARPLHADVCEVDGDLHVSELDADGEYIEWHNSSGKSHEFEVAPPDNMRLWRLAATGIGRWMGLLRRASERVYVPGGTGAEAVRREFEALAAVQ